MSGEIYIGTEVRENISIHVKHLNPTVTVKDFKWKNDLKAYLQYLENRVIACEGTYHKDQDPEVMMANEILYITLINWDVIEDDEGVIKLHTITEGPFKGILNDAYEKILSEKYYKIEIGIREIMGKKTAIENGEY